VGLGVRHALFPDSLAFGAQRPVVVDRWLPVPRRRATLLGPAECLRSRGGTGPPAANRRVGLVERGFSARGGIPPSTDPFLTRLVPGCDSLVPALFRKDRPMPPAGGPCRFPLRYGSCLFSLKLRSFSQAGEGLPVPSRFGSSCPPPLFAPAGVSSRGWTHSAKTCARFAFRLRHRNLPTACFGPRPSGPGSHTGSQ
jgi:hypothetical protein